MTVALRCSGVRVRYGGVEVLHGVGIAVPFGALTALVGPNGAGKSTLLGWCAAAASTATNRGGRLELGAAAQTPGPGPRPLVDVTSWSATRRAAFGLRLVPSGVNVTSTSLTVAENLRAGGEPRGGIGSLLELFPELVGLLAQRAATLSGGQRQLLALAGALGGRWRVLLVDEPVQGIAPALAERVYAALAGSIAPDRAILVADPVMHRAVRFADFVWRLERGRIVFAGEPSESGLGSGATQGV